MSGFHHEPTAELQMDTVTQTVISVPNASTTVLAANPERKYILLRSQGAGTTAIYIKFAASAAAANNSRELLDAEQIELGVGTGKAVYVGEIRAITASGSKDLYIEEWS